ncbi:immunoglobulin I-set domain protein [Teladorsagia circumcincta]|uniref:Immunoglobulin I-set domain protein n=1 Tax=Teladorsagia circumcincta TaxID=45464 RepID=A0A2G9UHR2_TELCI|nr:immunoglobulin I-set domain protein [Teladorsagia circumcincta]
MSTSSDNIGDAPSHRFRVAAENAVGTGSFIESEPVTIGIRPEIARDASKSLFIFPEGKDASITLSFSGKPAPSAEWTDSAGKLIKDSKKYKIKTTAADTQLTIKDVCPSNAGQYTLKVKNNSGEDSLPLTIQVQGRPDSPGKPSVQQKTADSVVLTWTEPKKDGGSPVQQFTVEMCTAANKKWKKAETTKQATTTLFNLVPGELYIFRVKASNKMGESEFSEESEPFSLKEPVAEEPKVKIDDEKVAEPIDYEKLDSKIDPLQQKEIDVRHLPNDLLDKYIICEELGQGAYGTVYRAIEKATGKVWAAKMVQVRPGVRKEDVLHEISIMNQLHHDKLLNLHEAFDLGNEMCLIEEFVSGGELLDKIIEDDMLMSEDEAKDYMRQILQGLEHMHKNQIVHLDLKPENILLKSKNSTDLKLVDFGLSRKLDPKKTVKLLFGTPEFCAPEVVNYEPVSFSTDMWSVGVITYVLLSGLSPFLGDTDEETLANVSAADWGFDDPVFDDVSDAAKDFICRLMCKDKRRRMTVKQALQHPWIAKTPKAPKLRGQLTPQQKKKFMELRRWSDDLLPIGRLAKRGAIFRQQSMDGVFERDISFDTEYPPNVKKQLEDIVAYVGDLIAVLCCEMDGSPLPQITWFKDEKQLVVPSIKYDSHFEDGLAELTVKNIEQSDAGVYRCCATNELGSVSTEGKLIVGVREAKTSPAELQKKKAAKVAEEEPVVAEAKPSFKPGLVDSSVMLGEKLILSVTSISAPDVTVEWFHNEKLIDEADKQYVRKHDKSRYELIIDSASLIDGGKWKVVGRNKLGQCESSCEVVVKIPDGFMAPTFEKSLEDVSCEEMELLTLPVKISANPPPEITWYCDEKELQHSLNHRLQFDDDSKEYSLTIVKAYKEDSGEYRCVARNVIGEAESVCYVRIDEPEEKRSKKIDESKAPKFSMHLVNPREVPEGAELILTCVVTGTPHPKITWLKDGKRYKDGQKLVVENRMLQYSDRKGVARLDIMNCVPGDSGEYSCEAVNALGKDVTECRVKVTGEVDEAVEHSPSPSSTPSLGYSSDDSRPPIITRPLVDTNVKAGCRELLELEVDGVPTPMIEWYHDGKLVAENRTLRTTFDGKVAVLKIYEAQPEHQGQYICKLGTPISLSCQVRGDQPLVISWLHNGRPITSDSRYRTRSFDDGISTLEIHALTEDLCGTYTVTASNPHGDSHSSAVVQVDRITAEAAVPSPPTFVVAPKAKFVVDESSSLTIVCDISGSSSMQVAWLKNGRPLNVTDRVQMDRDGLTSRLIITSVTPEDEGQYSVTAKDEFGEVTAESEVVVTPRREVAPTAVKIVKGPPSAIKGEPVVESCTKDSVSLSWSPPEDTHGSRLEDYKVEQRTPDQQNWVEVATVTRPRCAIKNLSPNTEYLFRVAARNAEGLSEGSLPVKVRTLSAGTKPLFTEPPTPSLAIAEDEELCIVAKFSGSPTPSVKWYKSGKEMTDSDGSITTESTSSVLTIAKARSGVDDAIYTCQIENEMGQASSDTAVSVVSSKEEIQEVDALDKVSPGAPSVAKPLSNETVQLGQQFTLSCRFAAKEGTAKWYHNDDKVTPTGRYELFTSSNGSQKLVCHNSNVTDAGVYRCVLTNEKGMAQTDCEVFVKGAEDQIAPVFEKNLEDITTLTGKKLVLSCRAIGHPEPDLVWTKDGERIATSRRVRLEFDDKGLSELHIHDCTAQDAGIYLCTATNTSGVQSTQCTVTVAEVSGKDAHLVIAEEEKIMKPRFIRAPPSTLEAQEGGQFKLIAKVGLVLGALIFGDCQPADRVLQ